jgi:hypothetical protein
LRGRKWVPEELRNKKRLVLKVKTCEMDASPGSEDEEEPEDLQLAEIQELEKLIEQDAWPSECLRMLSGEFTEASFMDEDDLGGGQT